MSTLRKICGCIVLVAVLLSLIGCQREDVKASISSPMGNASRQQDGDYVYYTVTMNLANLTDRVSTDIRGNLFYFRSNTYETYNFYTEDSNGGCRPHTIPDNLVTVYQQDGKHEITLNGRYRLYLFDHSEEDTFINNGDFEGFLSYLEQDNFYGVSNIDLYVPKGTIANDYILDTE